MLPHSAPAPQPVSASARRFGVGIDTLRPLRRLPARRLATGRGRTAVRRVGQGLRQLPAALGADCAASRRRSLRHPARCRGAICERPAHTPPLATELRKLRQVAGRLQAVVRQRTRLINQFHHLLALSFLELALLIKDIAAGWVLELVQRYPTAQLLARASANDLGNIPYLPDRHSDPLLEHARSSIASQSGAVVEELLRDQVRQLRDVSARQKRLENLLGRCQGDVIA